MPIPTQPATAPVDDPIGMILKAATFAAEKHRNQRRKDVDASPYINHPLSVADVLKQEGGIDDPVTICAALLHDTIEDTATTADELRIAFGPQVASVVEEVTDDKSQPKKRRKELQIEHARHLSSHAKVVKLADKICNLRDIINSPPAEWSIERKREYFDWSMLVVEGLRGANAHLVRVFDALYAQKP